MDSSVALSRSRYRERRLNKKFKHSTTKMNGIFSALLNTEFEGFGVHYYYYYYY